MQKYKKLIPFFLTFWAGMVTAISFLEAWLKFKAEGVTMEIGLSIGNLVFKALNRIELVLLGLVWLFAIVIYRNQLKKINFQNLVLGLITLILLTQTLWLLPILIHRGDVIISGGHPQSSLVHLWFVLFEFVKLVSLITLSLKWRISD